MTLTVKLAEQEQNRLDAIADAMNANQSDVIRTLINEKYESLQVGKTIIERMGGYPEHLLDSKSSRSERAVRRGIVAQKIDQRAAKRRPEHL